MSARPRVLRCQRRRRDWGRLATTVSQVQPPRSPWLLFLSQFKSVLILILIGAAGLAALIGNVKDAGVILEVVVINALVGFYQEYRAELSLAALRKMLPLRTHVRRDAKKLDIDADALVPGDVVKS